MTEAEMEDLENHLASHLKPVKPGADHWAKAMKLIKNVIRLQVNKALKSERRGLPSLPASRSAVHW